MKTNGKILVLGDLHLARLETMFKKWEAWSFAPLRQAESYAVAHDIPDIIQTGDVFDDSTPSQQLLTKLINFVQNSPVNWHFLMGNHDKSEKKKNSLTLMQHLCRRKSLTNCFVYLKPTLTKVNGVATEFLPWPHSKVSVTSSTLIVAHVERKGASYDNGKAITDHSFDLGKHFWVLGHLHNFQKIAKNGVFVGAPLQLRYGDSPRKYMVELNVTKVAGKQKFSYKKIRIKLPYRLKTLRIADIADNNWQKTFTNLKENVYLKLQLHSDVALPQQYLNHTQVTKHDYFGNKETKANATIKVDVAAIPDRIAALRAWLKNQNIERDIISRVIKKANHYESRLALLK